MSRRGTPGRRPRITRRDFLQGVAFSGVALAGSPGRTLAASGAATAASPSGSSYPPSLGGLRGNHAGAFEIAHALRDGFFWETAPEPTATGEEYDLVVVGGGISGLSAAFFHRERAASGARILVLDNHDDVGGHARRNEFRIGARMLLGFGGSYAIESPAPLGPVTLGILSQLGVDLRRGAQVTDRTYYGSRGLGRAMFLDQETFGADRLVPDPLGDSGGEANDHLPAGWNPWPGFMADAPLPEALKQAFRKLVTDPGDPLSGSSLAEKLSLLEETSYARFLTDHLRVDPLILRLLQNRTHAKFAVGIDAVSALEAHHSCLPGLSGMALDGVVRRSGSKGAACHAYDGGSEFVHYPDGNATFVRLLVRSLVPGSLPPGDPESLLPVPLDYRRLDRSGNPVRIRLSSTVVRVRHLGDPTAAETVEVAYVHGGELRSVRARQVVMACWNGIIPHLMPELPDEQKEALRYGVKAPLVYASVLVSDWKAFESARAFSIASPTGYFSTIDLGRAVRTSSYRAALRPEEPMVLHMVRTPCWPGLPARQQHRTGRIELLSTSFEDYEERIRDQLSRALGAHGFDPNRKIRGITINRWAHGYSYEYSTLWDREALAAPELPCVRGRRRFGRVAIANADAGAHAYMDGAIEQAHRAVDDLWNTG